MASKSGIRFRDLLLILLLVAFTGLVASRFTNASKLVATLSKGEWQWVIVALVTHLIYFFLYAYFYKLGFATVGVDSRAVDLLPVFFTSIFVNALAPTGGAGGAALYVNHLVQRGQSGAKAVTGLVLVLLADLATLIPFIVVGTFFLYSHHVLRIYDTVGGSIFVFFIVGLGVMLLLARWSPRLLRWLFSGIKRVINWIGRLFKRPQLLPEGWVESNTAEYIEGAEAIATHPKRLGVALAWGAFLHLINLAGLYAFFLAFHQSVNIGTLVAGFGMGIVFFVVQVLPQGAGAVEGIMTLVFTSLGVPSTKAIVIALAFRGVNFWLPLIIGLLFLPRVTSGLGDNLSAMSNQDKKDLGQDQGIS